MIDVHEVDGFVFLRAIVADDELAILLDLFDLLRGTGVVDLVNFIPVHRRFSPSWLRVLHSYNVNIQSFQESVNRFSSKFLEKIFPVGLFRLFQPFSQAVQIAEVLVLTDGGFIGAGERGIFTSGNNIHVKV